MTDIKDFHSPIHPGEILYEEFMVPYGLSANKLAKSIGVPANRITTVVKGTRAVTADTALRLSEFFGTTPEFWMTLQGHYELEIALNEDRPSISRMEAPAEYAAVAAE